MASRKKNSHNHRRSLPEKTLKHLLAHVRGDSPTYEDYLVDAKKKGISIPVHHTTWNRKLVAIGGDVSETKIRGYKARQKQALYFKVWSTERTDIFTTEILTEVRNMLNAIGVATGGKYEIVELANPRGIEVRGESK